MVSDPASTKASFTRLNAQIDNNNDVTCDRRKMLFKGFGSVLGVAAAVAGAPKQASASYSAYAAREKDWEERQEKGGKSWHGKNRCFQRWKYLGLFLDSGVNSLF